MPTGFDLIEKGDLPVGINLLESQLWALSFDVHGHLNGWTVDQMCHAAGIDRRTLWYNNNCCAPYVDAKRYFARQFITRYSVAGASLLVKAALKDERIPALLKLLAISQVDTSLAPVIVGEFNMPGQISEEPDEDAVTSYEAFIRQSVAGKAPS